MNGKDKKDYLERFTQGLTLSRNMESGTMKDRRQIAVTHT